MGEFLAFVLIVFSAVWGSIFLGMRLKLMGRSSDMPPDDRMLTGLREELEMVTDRLARIEEEMAFFRELRAPDEAPRLPGATAERSEGETPGEADATEE